jgi:hypothetical protein
MCPPAENENKASATLPADPAGDLKAVLWFFSATTLGLLIAVIVLAAGGDDTAASTPAANLPEAPTPAANMPEPSPTTTDVVTETVTETITITKEIEVMGFPTMKPPAGDNVCAGMKIDLPNRPCFEEGVSEQAGANVTKGYNGLLETTAVPITTEYWEAGLCPVNVHWHLGTEHYSAGEFDESGTGPTHIAERRKLAGKAREGFQCKYYDESDEKFTKEYDWKHCIDMEVGQTYEVHWPHSALGECGTLNQYQTPFYDGVFCNQGLLDATNIPAQIGVQAQIFTIVNDEEYYYPDLIKGMIRDGDMGMDKAIYTGSTTGTSRDNEICSSYTPITWQVDRKCHLVSASTFDKMCADMKAQRDDMSDDLYAHGSRELVADEYAANNHQNLRG